MQDISKLPHKLDRKKHECRAIIESPKGRRSKFKFDEESGLFMLSNLLPEGFSFPFEFGFVPSTAAEDGDPLDIIVLMDEPAHVGCLLDVRIVGVVHILQHEHGKATPNDRVIAVAKRSIAYREVKNVSDLPDAVVQQITEFLGLYNKNSGKDDEVRGVEGAAAAMKVVETAARQFESDADAVEA